MGSRRFFQAKAGFADENAKAIVDGLVARGHLVIVVRSADYNFGKAKRKEGVSDLLVYAQLGPSAHRLVPDWIEVKQPKGALRESQKEWKALAMSLGIRVTTVRHLVEAIAVVENGQ
jgi:hypothetical protein